MRKNKISDVIERLHLLLGVSNDSQLSEAMNIKRSTVGSWRARDSIPYAECVIIAEEKGVSLDWLLTGEGQMYKASAENAVNDQGESALSPREQAVLKMFNSLTDKEKDDIQKSLEEKKRLADLEKRIQQLELSQAKKGA